MDRRTSGEATCEKARRHFDAYISQELPAGTTQEVVRHIETCPACAAELEDRVRLRSRLKNAVNAQSVPPELRARIQQQIRNQPSGNWFAAIWTGATWPRWAAAAAMAAVVLVTAGVWMRNSAENLPAISDRPAQNIYIQKVSANLAAVLKLGLGDHIHCSIFRKYPQNPPPVQEMEEKLGPEYQGLLPVVRAAVPEGYRVIMAHQCTYAGRKFVHLTMEKEGDLLSLVIARKEDGESMAGLSPSSQQSGVAIYEGAAGRYQVAGFEAGRFLAYLISDLKAKTNLQVAANLAPAVQQILAKAA